MNKEQRADKEEGRGKEENTMPLSISILRFLRVLYMVSPKTSTPTISGTFCNF
jgi:hypothetical protein